MWSTPGPPWTATSVGSGRTTSSSSVRAGPDTSNHKLTPLTCTRMLETSRAQAYEPERVPAAAERRPLLGVSDPEELGSRAVATVYLQLKPDSGRRSGDVEAVPGAAGDPRLDLAHVRKRERPAGGVPGPAGVALGGAAVPQGDERAVGGPVPGFQAQSGRDILELVAVAAQGDRQPLLVLIGEGRVTEMLGDGTAQRSAEVALQALHSRAIGGHPGADLPVGRRGAGAGGRRGRRDADGHHSGRQQAAEFPGQAHDFPFCARGKELSHPP